MTEKRALKQTRGIVCRRTRTKITTEIVFDSLGRVVAEHVTIEINPAATPDRGAPADARPEPKEWWPFGSRLGGGRLHNRR
jgi:hypothetical protein